MTIAEQRVANTAGRNPHFHAVNMIATRNVIKGGEVLIYGWMIDLTANARQTVRAARMYGRLKRRWARTQNLIKMFQGSSQGPYSKPYREVLPYTATIRDQPVGDFSARGIT
jgi:hypothetical protein